MNIIVGSDFSREVTSFFPPSLPIEQSQDLKKLVRQFCSRQISIESIQVEMLTLNTKVKHILYKNRCPAIADSVGKVILAKMNELAPYQPSQGSRIGKRGISEVREEVSIRKAHPIDPTQKALCGLSSDEILQCVTVLFSQSIICPPLLRFDIACSSGETLEDQSPLIAKKIVEVLYQLRSFLVTDIPFEQSCRNLFANPPQIVALCEHAYFQIVRACLQKMSNTFTPAAELLSALNQVHSTNGAGSAIEYALQAADQLRPYFRGSFPTLTRDDFIAEFSDVPYLPIDFLDRLFSCECEGG